MRRTNAQLAIAFLTLSAGAVLARAADPHTIRALIQASSLRKPAPLFSLLDASGKAVRLSDYRGKVLLLNFWATECGGCRLEIPWFIELDQAYKDKAVAVVGVSMDILYEDLKNAKEGWNRVNPFVRAHQVNYRILMGDDDVTKLYDIQALPATYLIDPRGRIAATYVGLVNKDDVEANIKTLREEH